MEKSFAHATLSRQQNIDFAHTLCKGGVFFPYTKFVYKKVRPSSLSKESTIKVQNTNFLSWIFLCFLRPFLLFP